MNESGECGDDGDLSEDERHQLNEWLHAFVDPSNRGKDDDADDQDAVHQSGQEKHCGQTVGNDRVNEPHLVERICVQRNVGHIRANNPSITARKQANRPQDIRWI